MSKGRPALTPGEKPSRVEVLLPAATCKAIDDTGRKRSEYIRAAIAEKMERER